MTAVKPSYYLDTEVLCLLHSVYWEVESKIDSTLHFEAEISILPICFLAIMKSSEAGLPKPLSSSRSVLEYSFFREYEKCLTYDR